jgi:hypothetical protein
MSAKPAKKSVARAAPAPAADPLAPTPAPVAAATPPSWLDSSDPRKQRWGKVILAGVCLYVAALWLLALDRTFDWGLFGPKTATELKTPPAAKP